MKIIRHIISLLLLTLLIAIIAWIVKEYIQPKLTEKENQVINYFAIAIPIVAAVIYGIIQAVGALLNISDDNKNLITNKKVVKIILRKLNSIGDGGVRNDVFIFYMTSEHNELSSEERMQLFNEMESCGYIQRVNDMIKITKSGRNYIKGYWK